MTAAEYLKVPDKRDWTVFPVTAEEQRAMDSFDGEQHANLPDVAFQLIWKWHSVNNYTISDQSLKSALIAVRPLFGSAPSDVPDPNAWKTSQRSRDMREGRPMHEELHQLNQRAAEESEKELKTLANAADQKRRKEAFMIRMGEARGIVVGHPSGNVDWYKSRLAQKEELEKVKVAFPEFAQQVDAEIADLQSKLRM